MALTEESVIYLGEGTHYIQTSYGDTPYLSDEQHLKCNTSFDTIANNPYFSERIEIFKRRNPLRFLNFDAANADIPTIDGGDPDLALANYGSTFGITVKTWRCTTKAGTS